MNCPKCTNPCEWDSVNAVWCCACCRWVGEDVPTIKLELSCKHLVAPPDATKTIPYPEGWPRHASEVKAEHFMLLEEDDASVS